MSRFLIVLGVVFIVAGVLHPLMRKLGLGRLPGDIDEILTLARSEGVTTYDAAYLELAMRLGVPLATKDTALQQAAGKLGNPVLAV